MKKFLAIILIILMMAGLLMPVSAFEDTTGTPYEDAVKLLYDLGIVDGKSNTSYAPEDSLTRAEMVTYALRILGMDGLGVGRQVFDDVTEEHWAYANITSAYDLGLVVGVDEKTFQPDAPVTFAQAVKILVNILGYTLQAEAAGGYPSGYLSMARHTDLLKGVPRSEDINRGTMALLAANALDIHPSTLASYGDNDARVTILENETILSYYLGVDTYKGRITANSTDTVASGARIDAGEIALGDMVFSVGNTDAESFIGQKVIIRAKEENGILEILNITADGGSILEVSGDSILDSTTSSSLVIENESGKKDVYSIANNAVLVYNGVYKTWTAADLLSDSSMYTFVMDRGGEISVIFQNQYVNHVVKSASEELKKVYFKDGSSLSLSENDWGKMRFTKSDGSSASVSELAEWDVLSVAQNGASVLKAVVSSTRVEGTVSETSNKGVTIDEITYKIATNLSESADVKPEVGQKAIYSLDAYGKIAAVNTDTVSDNYGILVAGEKKGLESTVRMKLFTLEGKMQVFMLADKVKLNGVPMNAADVLNNTAISPAGTMLRQLVTYETNTEGKIFEIYTSIDGTAMDWEARQSVFSKDFYISEAQKASAGRYIGYNSSALASRYQIADKTRIFTIPQSKNADDKEYVVLTKRDIVHNQEFGNVTLYDIDKNNIISVLVQEKEYVKTVSPTSENFAVVDCVMEMLDTEGNVSPGLLVVLPSGKEKTLAIAEETNVEISAKCITDTSVDPYGNKGTMPISALEQGDIVQYETDYLGRVTAIAVRLRAKYRYEIEKAIYNGEDRAPDPNYNYYGTQYLYGTMNRTVEDGLIVYAPNKRGGTPYERLFSTIKGKTLLYEGKKGTIKAIDYTDYVKDEKIALVRINTDTLIVVAYR
ncbi:MAG: S-layer homology domain-containing protein [Clostridia bacterium]|nr:S-layer homology domain-containing protein [Clostridia bacterium]